MHRLFFITLLPITIFTCNDNSNIRFYHVAKSENNQINSINVQAENEVLEYVVPNKWMKSSGSSMRLISYSVPYSDGVGDLSVIRLGGNAGGVVANVNRWRGQLNLASINEDEINKITFTEKGNSFEYKWFEIINEDEPAAAFLCAILPEQDTTLFIKLNIPQNIINEVKNDFLNFCSSIIIPE